MNRILLLVRILNAKQWQLLSLLFSAKPRPKSWLNALVFDLKCLASSCEVFSNALTWSVAQWCKLIVEATEWFKSK
eukprot:1395433-Karenia_brevis.AAC.1